MKSFATAISVLLILGGVGVMGVEALTIFDALPRDYSPGLALWPAWSVWWRAIATLGGGMLLVSAGIALLVRTSSQKND